MKRNGHSDAVSACGKRKVRDVIHTFRAAFFFEAAGKSTCVAPGLRQAAPINRGFRVQNADVETRRPRRVRLGVREAHEPDQVVGPPFGTFGET